MVTHYFICQWFTIESVTEETLSWIKSFVKLYDPVICLTCKYSIKGFLFLILSHCDMYCWRSVLKLTDDLHFAFIFIRVLHIFIVLIMFLNLKKHGKVHMYLYLCTLLSLLPYQWLCPTVCVCLCAPALLLFASWILCDSFIADKRKRIWLCVSQLNISKKSLWWCLIWQCYYLSCYSNVFKTNRDTPLSRVFFSSQVKRWLKAEFYYSNVLTYWPMAILFSFKGQIQVCSLNLKTCDTMEVWTNLCNYIYIYIYISKTWLCNVIY